MQNSLALKTKIYHLESNKKYHCIYADPPWETRAGRPFDGYRVANGKQIFNCKDNQSRELNYPTMTIDEIASLNIKSMSEKDAHLYIWVINKYILEVKKIIQAWGFKYSTTIIWSKTPMGGGLGGAFGISHEFLLFCRRGQLKTKNRIKGTVHHVKRPYLNGKPCHSKKPEYFANLIEQVSPGPYLELFARERRKGWDSFGNEVDDSIKITKE